MNEKERRGRKKVSESEKTYTISTLIGEEDLARLDRIAGKLGYSRSKTMRRMLLLGIDVVEECNKVGIIDLTKMFKMMAQAMTKAIYDRQLRLW